MRPSGPSFLWAGLDPYRVLADRDDVCDWTNNDHGKHVARDGVETGQGRGWGARGVRPARIGRNPNGPVPDRNSGWFSAAAVEVELDVFDCECSGVDALERVGMPCQPDEALACSQRSRLLRVLSVQLNLNLRNGVVQRIDPLD